MPNNSPVYETTEHRDIDAAKLLQEAFLSKVDVDRGWC